MAKYSTRQEKEPEIIMPTTCGVAGCLNRCDVYIREHDISRCADHYQMDVDRAGRSSSQFVYEQGMPIKTKVLSYKERYRLLQQSKG